MREEVNNQIIDFINNSNLSQEIKSHPAFMEYINEIVYHFYSNSNDKNSLIIKDGKLSLVDDNKIITLETTLGKIIYNEESYRKTNNTIVSYNINQISCSKNDDNLEIEDIEGTSLLKDVETIKHIATSDHTYYDSYGIEIKIIHNYGETTDFKDKLYKGTLKAYEDLSIRDGFDVERHYETVVTREYLDVATYDSIKVENGQKTRKQEYKALSSVVGLKNMSYTIDDDDIYKLNDSQIEQLLKENNDQLTYEGLKRYIKDRKDFERIKSEEIKKQM